MDVKTNRNMKSAVDLHCLDIIAAYSSNIKAGLDWECFNINS